MSEGVFGTDLENLKRKVYIDDGVIKVSTESFKRATYAFYLNHKLGTEKVFYSNYNFCSFDVAAVAGEYSARFFYKVGSDVKAVSVYFVIDNDEGLFYCDVQIVVDRVGFSIEHYDMEGEITFVVFNGDGSKKLTSPFGLGFLVKRGYNVVAVKQEDNRYQSLSFNDFKYYVEPLVNGRSVYLYGSSLGGYCALYYAGAIDGHVIAAAPRNPLHPCLSDFTKAVGEYRHDLFSVQKKTNKNVLVIVDANNYLDKIFLEKYVKVVYEDCKILEINGVGHEVLLHLNYTGELKLLIDDFVSGGFDGLSVDSSLSSPYRDKETANYLYERENYREAILYASKSLLKSNRVSLDNQLSSIIKSALRRI